MAERKRSNVWMHFSMSASSNEVAKCDICKCEYSIRGGTSNLSKHLRVKHIIDYMKFFLFAAFVSLPECKNTLLR